jgi:hypothetical protein
MPESRGQGFASGAKLDADPASDFMNRRSRTCFLVWINRFLFTSGARSKLLREMSSYGSELVPMKQCSLSQRNMIQAQNDWDPCEWPVLLTCVCSGCVPWWFNHRYCVRCVFPILVWMCFLWHSRIFEVDVNPDGWTTQCLSHLVWHKLKWLPWWLNHWNCVRCVFHILVWIWALWHSRVFDVDVNPDGWTTSLYRVDARYVTWPLMNYVWLQCLRWMNHWYRVRCVFSILVWMRFHDTHLCLQWMKYWYRVRCVCSILVWMRFYDTHLW